MTSQSESASGGSRQEPPSRLRLRTVEILPRSTAALHLGVSAGDDAEKTASMLRRIRRNRNPLGSLLLSMLVHTLLLLALASFMLAKPDSQASVSLIAEFVSVPTPEISETEMDRPIVEITIPDENNSLLENDSADSSISDNIPTPVISTNDSERSADQQSTVENTLPVAPEAKTPLGGGLEGRNKNARASRAAKRGGTRESERAVERGLRWIVNHQRSDGSWRLDFRDGPCEDRCRNPGTKESTTAATGLALMALLGAGYTHQTGPYQNEVRRGIDYLLSRMRKTYFGGNLAEGSMYAQGIATIALSEAYAMTGDERLAEPAKLAMDYIVTAQHSKGGWRYNPGEPGDMTVTGWQLMALKSCQLAKLSVPQSTLRNAKKFINSLGESGGYYGYTAPDRQPAPTAIGLLMQMYLGWDRENEALLTGVQYLMRMGPSKNDVYFNYYATQVLHHQQSKQWSEWNEKMRDYLVRTQSDRGHESGSWFFRDTHGNVGGRLYTTAMAVMILEVYYRYMPLYDRPATEN